VVSVPIHKRQWDQQGKPKPFAIKSHRNIGRQQFVLEILG